MPEDEPGWENQQPLNSKGARAQAAAAEAYSTAQRNWFARHKIFTGLRALTMLVVVISVASSCVSSSDTMTAAGGTSKSPKVTATAGAGKSATSGKPAAEPPLEVSSKELIAALEANALKAKKTYKGKRVKVSGFVGNIDASGKYFALDPEPQAVVFTGIQVQTGKDFQDQLAEFSAGQPVTVTGTISDVGEILGYQLKAETIA